MCVCKCVCVCVRVRMLVFVNVHGCKLVCDIFIFLSVCISAHHHDNACEKKKDNDQEASWQ